MVKYVASSGVMAAVLLVIPHPTSIPYTVAVTLLGGTIYLLILLATDSEFRSLAESIIRGVLKKTRLEALIG